MPSLIEMTAHWKEYVEATRRILAEYFTVDWSEDLEKGIDALARKIANNLDKLRAKITTTGGLGGVLGVGVTAGAGAIPTPPPVVLPTYREQIATWAEDFAAATQKASVATWGLRRMGFMFTQLGNNIEQSGKKIVNTMASAVQSYLDFNEVMAKTGVAIGLTSKESAALSDNIVDMAKELGAISPEELATGYKSWAQAEGALLETEDQRNTVLAQSVKVAKLAEMHNADLGNTIDSVSGIMTVFNKDAGDLDDVLAQLNFGVTKTSTTLGDFGILMRDVGPVAKDLGMDFEDLIAAQMLLAKANIRGSQAMMTTRSTLQNLAEPSTTFTENMNKLVGVNDTLAAYGFSWLDEFGGRLPTLAEFVGLLARETENLTDKQRAEIIATVSNSRSQAGLLAMVNAQIEAYKRNSDAFEEAMVSNAEAVDFMGKAWAEYEKQDSVRAQKMKQRWDEVGRSIGKSLIDLGLEPAEALSEHLDKLSEFLEEHPGLSTGAALTGGGLIGAGQVWGLLGSLAQVATLITMLASKGVLTTAATVGTGVLGAGAAAVAPALPAVALAAAMAGVILALRKFGKDIEEIRLKGGFGEESRTFLESNFEFYKRQIATHDFVDIIRPTTPLGEELLGGPEMTFDLQEKERILARIVDHLQGVSSIETKELFPMSAAERAMLSGRQGPLQFAQEDFPMSAAERAMRGAGLGGVITSAEEFIPDAVKAKFESLNLICLALLRI